MPEYLLPGVYIEESGRGPPPVIGVATSGEAECGPMRPQLMTGCDDDLRLFGEVYADGKHVPFSAKAFFDNGGRALYIVSVTGPNAAAACRTLDRYAPGIGHTDEIASQRAIVAHCERNRFRVAVLDSATHQSDLSATSPRRDSDTQYGAFYHPWYVTPHPKSGADTLVPPGAAMCGIFARTDRIQGVRKAPTNVSVAGAIDLEFESNTTQQESLSARGVNRIQSVSDQDIRVWGARTLSSDPGLHSLKIRRYLIFLKAAIAKPTQ